MRCVSRVWDTLFYFWYECWPIKCRIISASMLQIRLCAHLFTVYIYWYIRNITRSYLFVIEVVGPRRLRVSLVIGTLTYWCERTELKPWHSIYWHSIPIPTNGKCDEWNLSLNLTGVIYVFLAISKLIVHFNLIYWSIGMFLYTDIYMQTYWKVPIRTNCNEFINFGEGYYLSIILNTSKRSLNNVIKEWSDANFCFSKFKCRHNIEISKNYMAIWWYNLNTFHIRPRNL